MKKLFYIVLVIVALMVISRFVKEKSNTAATTTAVTAETSEPVTATLPDINCVCDTEPACNPGDENCDPDAAKSTCNCEQPNGETVTIEQTVEEVRKSTPTKLPATMKPSLTTKQLPRRRHPLRPRLSRQQNNRVTLGKKMLSKSCSGEQLFYCFL